MNIIANILSSWQYGSGSTCPKRFPSKQYYRNLWVETSTVSIRLSRLELRLRVQASLAAAPALQLLHTGDALAATSETMK